MSYTQLAAEQRYQIYALMKAGHRQTKIAAVVGVHKSTISREVRRNRGLRGYRPLQAHQLAIHRRQAKAQCRLTPEHWSLIERLLQEDWSPEQISLWLADQRAITISPEWIYQHVLQDKAQDGILYRHLRCQKTRKKRYGAYDRRGHLRNRVSIEERPGIVEDRTRLGDWELDTIIGKGRRQALVSLTERRSRLALIAKVPSKEAAGVTRAILKLLAPLSEHVHTLTADNGKEFAQHEAIAKTLNADFYFAHPYASWERGLNENTNGLIRQYFPKSCDFTTITQRDLDHVMHKLNNRPRKCLGMQTPNQVCFGINPFVALVS
jgi:IS30 family transposase